MRISSSIGVGLLATLLVATFIKNGLGFILFSIICTGGLSLTLWLPVWWAIGAVFLLFFQQMQSEQGSSVEATVAEEYDARMDTPQNVQLVSYYIHKRIAQGGSTRVDIFNHLQKVGWSDETIRQAFEQLSQPKRRGESKNPG